MFNSNAARLYMVVLSQHWLSYRAVLSNVFWLVLEKGLTIGFVLACDAMLARTLSVSEYGEWQYALNLASLLGCIGFVAGAEVIVPALTRHQLIRSEIISAGAVVRSVFALITILISFIVCEFFVSDPSVRTLTMMAVVIVVVNEAGAVCIAYFQAATNMWPVATCRLIALAFRASLFYFAALYLSDATIFAAVRWMESALLCGLFVVAVRAYGAQWKLNKRVLISIMCRGIKFLPPIIMMYAFTRIDRIYFERYLSFDSVAVYSIAQQYVEQCFMLLTIIVQTLAPKYIYSLRDNDLLNRQALKIAMMLVVMALISIAGTLLISEGFVVLIFGNRYIEAADYMQILTFATIPFAIDSVATQLLLKNKAANYLLMKWVVMVIVAYSVYEFVVPLIGVEYLRYVFLFNFCCMAIASILVLFVYQHKKRTNKSYGK